MDGANSVERGRRTTRAADVEVLVLCCECGRRTCSESLRVSLPTLEWARSRGLTLVAHGHETPDDALLARTAGFLLVRAASA